MTEEEFNELMQVDLTPEKTLERVKEAITARTTGAPGYVALMTQIGEFSPSVTVLANSLPGDIVWSYIGIGQYKGTLVGAFTVSKTFCIINTSGDVVGEPNNIFGIKRLNNNEVLVTSCTPDGVTPSDNRLSNTSIEIRVYS